MDQLARIRDAISRAPRGLFVMTSAFEDASAGVLVRSVQSCAHEPPLISVALLKGHAIEPIIRDSHCFAVCQVDPADRLMSRLFAHDAEQVEDPFAAVPVRSLKTGSPVLLRSNLALDCEVVRHFDLEADHELYIGHVVDCRVVEPAA